MEKKHHHQLIEFLFVKNYKEFDDYSDLKAAMKYGSEETIQPLVDKLSDELNFLQKAVKNISENSSLGKSIKQKSLDLKGKIDSLDFNDLETAGEIQKEMGRLFYLDAPSLIESVFERSYQFTDEDAMTILEHINLVNERASRSNTEWIELCSDTQQTYKLSRAINMTLNNVGIDKNPVPGVNLYATDTYSKAMTKMLAYSTATRLFKNMRLPLSESFLDTFDVSQKDIASIKRETGSALDKIQNPTYGHYDLCSRYLIREDDLKMEGDPRDFERIISESKSIKEFIQLNQFMTPGGKSIVSQLNTIEKLSSDIIQQASTIQSLRQEVNSIFEEFKVRNVESDFKPLDASKPNWYMKYFHKKSDLGAVKLKELLDPNLPLLESLDRNLEFLREDLSKINKTLFNESKRLVKEAKGHEQADKVHERRFM